MYESHKRILILSLLAVMSACSSSPDSPLIRNPEIERWCDGRPCEWNVRGDVERVGSWHPNDYAVDFVSDDAQIYQDNATATRETAPCIHFSMIAKITRGTKLFLELDFLRDDLIDFSARLPVSDWEKQTFRITAPSWYRGVRFILRKEGEGTAMIAELSAGPSRTCTAPPIDLGGRPDGAPCSADDDCSSGQCNGTTCGGCSDSSSCQEGETCGLYTLDGAPRHTCMPQGSLDFGEVCDADAQCQSGFCVSNACSECEVNSCPEGQLCRPAHYSGGPRTVGWPYVCNPNTVKREAGQLCTFDSDCASFKCVGALSTCDSSCTGSDFYTCLAQCPVGQIRAGRCE